MEEKLIAGIRSRIAEAFRTGEFTATYNRSGEVAWGGTMISPGTSRALRNAAWKIVAGKHNCNGLFEAREITLPFETLVTRAMIEFSLSRQAAKHRIKRYLLQNDDGSFSRNPDCHQCHGN